ncbi:DegV family protein [Desulfosporosinus sp. FKA]|uniref:DegV family protein n=1 Tax=Desulfosporosinus sp. FKA TaxID=1969834 RepID=UPI000B49D997|nr:DegV family protein [Desulfosporosinus sp. FKA]
MKKIILSADSTCDFDDKLKERYELNCCPLHILLAENDFRDGIDITPDDIFDTYQKRHILPKTAAPNPAEYVNYFKRWTDEGHDVIHLSLGSGLSSSYQNCCLAAQELKGVYPIDSGNLSTGIGLLVIEAAERLAKGMSAEKISEEVKALRSKVQASFVLDNLTYLYEGGRCSALAVLGANVLSIKPCIEVDNSSGKMKVGKKYRGAFDKVLKSYTIDKLHAYPDINLDRVFIVHSGISSEYINLVRKNVEEITGFKEIIIAKAGCTISSHCGPNTLGVMFMTN